MSWRRIVCSFATVVFVAGAAPGSAATLDWNAFATWGAVGAFADDCVGNTSCSGGPAPDPTRSRAKVEGTFDGATAFGEISLGAGTQKLSVLPNPDFLSGTQTGANVAFRLNETLAFTSPLINANQQDVLSWTYSLSGTFSPNSSVLFDVYAQNSLGELTRVRQQFSRSGGQKDPNLLNWENLATATPSFGPQLTNMVNNSTASALVFTGQTVVDPSDPTVTFFLSLSATGLFALQNTGTLELNLGEGQSIVSGSGVFLTGADLEDDPSVIPLPASWLLLIGGLAGVVGLRRKSAS